MGVMIGDWSKNDIPCLVQNNKQQVSSSPGQAFIDNSLLSVDVSVRANDPKRHTLADRLVVKIVSENKAAAEIATLNREAC
jgi:hypothetical protein